MTGNPEALDLTAFKATLEGAAPPADLGGALAALWRAAKGDWQAAHHPVWWIRNSSHLESLFRPSG